MHIQFTVVGMCKLRHVLSLGKDRATLVLAQQTLVLAQQTITDSSRFFRNGTRTRTRTRISFVSHGVS